MTREKDTLAEEVATLRSQKDELSSQQERWDELRTTSEQMHALVELMQRSDNEEMKELRRARDKLRTLEVEHASVQRRLKDQEAKVTNNERAAQAARQSLSQAQQRAVEWEKRANEYESELQSTRDKLDKEEQEHRQLEADHALVKMQLEERDAEERLAKVRT